MGADCSSEGEDNWRKGERIRQQRQSKCSRLHGFIMRSMARLHFKRMVHRCLRKTFLVAKGCFFFFFKHLLISNESEKEFMTTCFLNKYSKKREGGCLKSRRSLANFVKGREHEAMLVS